MVLIACSQSATLPAENSRCSISRAMAQLQDLPPTSSSVQVELEHDATEGRLQLPGDMCIQACLLTEDFQGTCTDRVLHELIGGVEHPEPARCAVAPCRAVYLLLDRALPSHRVHESWQHLGRAGRRSRRICARN